MRRRIRLLLFKGITLVLLLAVASTVLFFQFHVKQQVLPSQKIAWQQGSRHQEETTSSKTLTGDPLSTDHYIQVYPKVIPGKLILGTNCSVIVMGTTTAQTFSLQRAIDKKLDQRPEKDDLFVDILQNFDVSVLMVKIIAMQDNNYISELYLRDTLKKKIISLDTKPSDALIVAAWFNAPIYVDENLFNKDKQTIC